MDLQEVGQQIYGLVPEQFTKARNDLATQARSEGDRQLARDIRALRRPSTAAWLVNLLVRRRADEMRQVLELGALMREAHRNLAGERLRSLDRQRKELVLALTDQARALADEVGHAVSDQIAGQVQQTLHAAMADAGAAAAVSAGMLTDAIEATGLGPVDVTGAVAMPVPDVRPAEPVPDSPDQDGDEQARVEARADVARAEAAVSELAEAAARARQRTQEAGGRRQRLEADRAELQQQLRALEGEIAEADEAVRRGQREQETIEEEQHAAERAVQKARSRLGRLS